jgi:PPOX class probable F420-dependent enzyme
VTPILTSDQGSLIADARTATLATLGRDGRPRLVPVCHALAPVADDRPVVYTPLDEKPKRGDTPTDLARVKDLLARPEVTLLVHRWDEDWSRLAWVRAYGTGEVLEPRPHERAEHAAAVALLREKYPQYREHALETRPVIRIRIERVVSWTAGASA